MRGLVVHGVTKLIDYQDTAYARRYLELLRPFVPAVTRQCDADGDRPGGGALTWPCG